MSLQSDLLHLISIEYIYQQRNKMMKKKVNREQSSLSKGKRSLSKKQKKCSPAHSEKPKINIEKLSYALYNHQLQAAISKIILYDEFQSERQDIDGAITARYQHLETVNGQSLHRCEKVDNLQQRKGTFQRKKSKDKCEKILKEARYKKKENKNQMNLRSMNRDQRLAGRPLVNVTDS